MTKNLKITIATIAYNEEKNILALLDQIFKQTLLKKHHVNVVLVSDGSTDLTANLCRKHFPSVRLFEHKKNIGKNKRLNEIMQQNKADLLFQIDADVAFKDRKVLAKMVKKYLKHKHENIGIICSHEIADKPKTFAQKVGYFGFELWERARKDLGEKSIRYYCEGSLRCFTLAFTKTFNLPVGEHIGEDTYSFYFAIKNGFGVIVAKDAFVIHPLPLTFKDYKKQMKRFLLDPNMISKKFDSELLSTYEVIGVKERVFSFLKEFIKAPLVGSVYIINQLFTKFEMLYYQPKEVWSKIERSQI